MTVSSNARHNSLYLLLLPRWSGNLLEHALESLSPVSHLEQNIDDSITTLAWLFGRFLSPASKLSQSMYTIESESEGRLLFLDMLISYQDGGLLNLPMQISGFPHPPIFPLGLSFKELVVYSLFLSNHWFSRGIPSFQGIISKWILY